MAKRMAAAKASSGIEDADRVIDAGRDGSSDAVVDGQATPGAGGKPSVGSGTKAGGKAGAKAAAKKVATITLMDIGDHLAATYDIPKSHAKIYMVEAVALIAKQLRKGAKVRLSGLGTLQVKKRAARKARNPNTGEEVKVKAGRRVVFAAAQDFKAKL